MITLSERVVSSVNWPLLPAFDAIKALALKTVAQPKARSRKGSMMRNVWRYGVLIVVLIGLALTGFWKTKNAMTQPTKPP